MFDDVIEYGGIHVVSGKFDAIILNHVIEHFLDPVESFKKLLTFLEPDGVIYVGCPNILNLSLGQIQNAHTYYFTPNLLKYYCEQTSCRQIESGAAENIHMYAIFKKTESS